MEPPTYIYTNELKYSVNEYGMAQEWSYGEIITVIYNNQAYKYCYYDSKDKRKSKYCFVYYPYFIQQMTEKKRKKKIKYNSAEATFLYDYISKYKIEKGCIVCGYNKHAEALQFDHIDSNNKEDDVSDMAANYRKAKSQNRPLLFIQAIQEIEKCVVMCANCHAVKSKKQKCGVHKLERNYNTPEEFLLGNNKSTCSFMTLNENQYHISKKNKKKIEDPQLVVI